ncbi:MAG TPA: methylenetetrahydrofolate reductase [NAD(P)H] [Dehalococcoidia bacterium]|nr:methylenetetrahydrofolate reductase [NAD(P)H] [Dehalococcoidia bacterium]
MKIRNILKSKQTISFEFFPPKLASGLENVIDKMNVLSKYNPDFISITYGAGGSTQSFTEELSRIAKRDLFLEVMSHITCVGQTANEIDNMLNNLLTSNIKNIIALRGDPPKGETNFTQTPGGFKYASELINHINQNFDFGIAAAGYPETHIESFNIEQDIEHLKSKVSTGVDFLITQLFFDNNHYYNFVDRARNAGIEVPIIPGILPILSVPQIRRITQLCGASIPMELNKQLEFIKDDNDAAIQLGIEHATKQVQDLLKQGAPGIHFYVLNKNYSIEKILTNLNLVPSE